MYPWGIRDAPHLLKQSLGMVQKIFKWFRIVQRKLRLIELNMCFYGSVEDGPKQSWTVQTLLRICDGQDTNYDNDMIMIGEMGMEHSGYEWHRLTLPWRVHRQPWECLWTSHRLVNDRSRGYPDTEPDSPPYLISAWSECMMLGLSLNNR